MKLLTPTALLFALSGAAILNAQYPLPPEGAERVASVFQPSAGEQILACVVHPLAPALTYRLVDRAGYSAVVPMDQLTEQPRRLDVLVRVTPKEAGSRPLVLRQSETLPAEAESQGRDASKFELQVKGGFYLGAGEYHVEVVVIGGGRRVCRKQWDVELKPHKGLQGVLAPGHMAAMSQLELPRVGAGAGSLTVFVNAGSEQERPVLLQSLAAVLDSMPFRRVQVVVFSLDQRKELVRLEVNGSAGFDRIAEMLRNYNPAVVSYGVLQDPAGHRDFLWQLLAKEEVRVPRADAVLFLGRNTFDDRHVMVPPACGENARQTRCFYFVYARPGRPSPRMPEAGPYRRRLPGMPARQPVPDTWDDLPQAASLYPVLPDVIARATRACSGKVFSIYSPDDLALAIGKTSELLSRR